MKKIITIEDSKENVEFWQDQVGQFFDWKHELLERYMTMYPKVRDDFLNSRKKPNKCAIVGSHYRPCTIRITDGVYFDQLVRREITNQIQIGLLKKALAENKGEYYDYYSEQNN